ncbi:hypothetical protein L1987_19848 [Smallanthus sonchifolius]|uniref:Uncharacterized protein n=1 Tax=Smallanthus sonchifolius TaxID=185202 RepID=A0ACB9IT50_9ASTR|nr:hypothetical protein L1987_19848 [Smallanthus sonchifolius]
MMNMKSVQSSSYRDRTQEFSSITGRLRKSVSLKTVAGINSSGGAGGSSKADGSRSSIAFQSEFNKIASKIGYGIHHTSQKLGSLLNERKLQCTRSKGGGVYDAGVVAGRVRSGGSGDYQNRVMGLEFGYDGGEGERNYNDGNLQMMFGITKMMNLLWMDEKETVKCHCGFLYVPSVAPSSPVVEV